MEIDITEIVVAVIGLLGVIITGIVIPYIKSKTTAEQWETIKAWTVTAVRAAEVIFKGTGLGSDKRAYVTAYIKELCKSHHIKIDEITIRNALEEAVKEMNQEAKDGQ